MNKDNPDKAEEVTSSIQPEEDNDTPDEEPRRRLQDNITSKTPTRKMNLDRRCCSDRRGKYDTNYKGPSRRLTIDRRVNNKDRRKKID